VPGVTIIFTEENLVTDVKVQHFSVLQLHLDCHCSPIFLDLEDGDSPDLFISRAQNETFCGIIIISYSWFLVTK